MFGIETEHEVVLLDNYVEAEIQASFHNTVVVPIEVVDEEFAPTTDDEPTVVSFKRP